MYKYIATLYGSKLLARTTRGKSGSSKKEC